MASSPRATFSASTARAARRLWPMATLQTSSCSDQPEDLRNDPQRSSCVRRDLAGDTFSILHCVGTRSSRGGGDALSIAHPCAARHLCADASLDRACHQRLGRDRVPRYGVARSVWDKELAARCLALMTALSLSTALCQIKACAPLRPRDGATGSIMRVVNGRSAESEKGGGP
jgi:hypothetical protein